MITENIILFAAGIGAAAGAWLLRKVLHIEERVTVLETHLADKLGNTPAPIRRRKLLGFL